MLKIAALFLCLAVLLSCTIISFYLTDDRNISGTVLVVTFVAYPFIIGGMTTLIAERSIRRYWMYRMAIVFALVGIGAAIWLNLPHPKIKMVAPLAGVVLASCFMVSGAFVGAALDALILPRKNVI